ncbi:hypothetical protein L1765_09850 [Microaerobacter geothermalis]|uniref:sugar-binding transcriptional regulator n=1 Tax=Microaerobacter geothermalis TaxID=674972 RepID=UPI001F3AC96D|nr:sugar-binding domain-containing protein [Microaerobacter geothermalis]MCF6094266.1 hypothetical protein [Microaerobacter geothermalis]
MNKTIFILQKIHPDLLQIMMKRHGILRYIRLLQPVGRRVLASYLKTTERILRGEVELLKEQNLILIEPVGMSLTGEGNRILQELDLIIRDFAEQSPLEKHVKELFQLDDVFIIPGNSDVDELVKKEMGRIVAQKLNKSVQSGDIVAVTGGTSIAMVAEMMQTSQLYKDVWFVPARGGLGEKMEFQANTLASIMAAKTGGSYRLLHVPDRLSETSYQSLVMEPEVQEILHLIKSSKVIVHGIGEALKMAKKRQADEEVIKLLKERKAVGEAFGYYFNLQGEITYKMPTIGLRMEDVKNAETVIAVAGGSSKAEAIYSVIQQNLRHILVTDQAAAEALVQLHQNINAR